MLPTLFSLLSTPLASECLVIVDEVLQASEGPNGDPSIRTVMLGQKAITKITREGNVSLMKEAGWSWSDILMIAPRALLADVVSTYMSVQDQNGAKDITLTRSKSFADSIQEASTEKFEPEFEDGEEYLHNYGELLDTLQDLDDFFAADFLSGDESEENTFVQQSNDEVENDHGHAANVDEVISESTADGNNMSFIDSYILMNSPDTSYSRPEKDLSASKLPNFSYNHALDDFTLDVSTPIRPSTAPTYHSSRLLSLPAVKVYLLVPVKSNRFDASKLSALFSGFTSHKVETVPEKTTDSVACFLFSFGNTTGTQNVTFAENVMSLINSRDPVLFTDPRSESIDTSTKCTVSIGALDMLIVHSPSPGSKSTVLSKFLGQPSTAMWDTFASTSVFDSPTKILHLSSIASYFHDESIELMKQHLLAVSGVLPDECCKTSVALMRSLRSVVLPDNDVFSCMQESFHIEKPVDDEDVKSIFGSLKSAFDLCESTLTLYRSSHNALNTIVTTRKVRHDRQVRANSTSRTQIIRRGESETPISSALVSSGSMSMKVRPVIQSSSVEVKACELLQKNVVDMTKPLVELLFHTCALADLYHRHYEISWVSFLCDVNTNNLQEPLDTYKQMISKLRTEETVEKAPATEPAVLEPSLSEIMESLQPPPPLKSPTSSSEGSTMQES